MRMRKKGGRVADELGQVGAVRVMEEGGGLGRPGGKRVGV